VLRITDRGQAFLSKHQSKILVRDLMQFPEFAAFRGKSSTASTPDQKATPTNDKTPLERIEEAHKELETTVAKELLDKVAASSPTAFERLVIQLLLKMGYGGGESDASKHLGGSNDVGVDGVINQAFWDWTVCTSKPSDGRTQWVSTASTPLPAALR